MMKQVSAEQVRKYVAVCKVEPARRIGAMQVEIRAGDVHKEMGLSNRMPLVCSALHAKVFASSCRLRLVHATEPHQGANHTITFEVLP
jgi:5-methylcytosine-specific restriction enzyme B